MRTLTFVLTLVGVVLVSGCGDSGTQRLSVPPAITITAPDAVAVGSRVVITAEADNRGSGTIMTRTWEQTAGPTLQLSGFEGKTVEFSAPRLTKSADVTLEHCITDDARHSVCKDVTLTVLSAVDLGLRGGIRSLLDVLDPTTGLPVGEASLRELHNGRFSDPDWSPQDAAMVITGLVIGHALTAEDPTIYEGLELDDKGLLARFDKLFTSLELIAKDGSRHFPARDHLAFYHLYQGRVPRSDSLGRFVSFEDNALLYTALTLAANYLADVDTDMADRATALRDKLDLSLWKSPDGTISLGTTELPVAQEKIDRFLTQQRISLVAARASGALTRAEFTSVVNDLIANSAVDADGLLLPPLGEMREVYAPVPWLDERESALFPAVLQPLYAKHVAAADKLGVPVSQTAVPVVQRRTVEYALSPFEGTDPLLEEFQDLPVLVPPGAAMLTAMGDKASITNYEETVLIIQNEDVGIDAYYGPQAVYDYGVTATVPDGVSPMYGTVQTGYAVAALASNRLDTYFLTDLLRRDTGWNTGIVDYLNLLDADFGTP